MNNYQFITSQNNEIILGKGTYGTVKRAKHITSNIFFAIKIIQKKYINKYNNETNIHKTINHPNIITLHETYQDENHIYLILEYNNYKKYTINQLLDNNEIRCKNICIQLLKAIQYLHHNNIIHLDIKEDNILTDKEQKTIKLCDFGSAIKLSEIDKFNNKQSIQQLGTIYYRDPEILKYNIGPHNDIWSLGIVLFKILQNYNPYQIYRDKYFQFINDKKIWTQYTKSCQDFIISLLQPNPNNRLSITQCIQHPWINN